jgi:hypothetical protein
MKQIRPEVALPHGCDIGRRRVLRAADFEMLDREAPVRLRAPIQHRERNDRGQQQQGVAQKHDQLPNLDTAIVSADAIDVGRPQEAIGRFELRLNAHTFAPASASLIS